MNGQRTGDSSRPLRRVVACALAAFVLVAGAEVDAQLSYSSGQTISPAYEGYEVNPDGSYDLLFGYLNRNWDEELNIPVGPDNYFSPGLADRGQPTHFLPRRNRFVFRVHLPADFDPDQEVVWTLRSQGQEKKAYASLRQDLLVDNMVIASETGALGGGRSDPSNRLNETPVIELETDRVIAAVVGQPVTLIARVSRRWAPSHPDAAPGGRRPSHARRRGIGSERRRRERRGCGGNGRRFGGARTGGNDRGGEARRR